jgi:NTP pyrophosphatase (non-canonical NTP hydrolase)
MTETAAPSPGGRNSAQPAPSVGDWLGDLLLLVAGARVRFGAEDDVFRMVSRLAEETGELAEHVNHVEGMGRKVQRYGPADASNLIKETLDVVRCAVAICAHYDGVPALRRLTREKLAYYAERGWLAEAGSPRFKLGEED